ncbi:hypothetical protein LTR84_008276 [Exophiala bonariae]|uniref:Uncharacterized protein n=1 Tax=Exophiala bonariae TaxID=1690606 RepID=A0AAV9MZU1_9EURO|nr:hypothetical protein LTR84_008276 [Exophiala bonariae]
MAGHFAHMEFVTGSELNFPFARNVARLARQTVEKASQSGTHTPIPHIIEEASNMQQQVDTPSQGLFDHGNDDFSMDDWGFFSSTLMGDGPFNSYTGFNVS